MQPSSKSSLILSWRILLLNDVRVVTSLIFLGSFVHSLGPSQLVVSCQVVTNPCRSLAVIFCGFISHLIGRETVNIPEIFSGDYEGFTGKTLRPRAQFFP